MIVIEKIRKFIENEDYEFYAHALIEAKKDGVEPEDMVYVLLTGKIIERYQERKRILVCGRMLNEIPLHIVCNYSDPDLLYIVTVYIPSREDWANNFQRRKKGKRNELKK